MLLAERVMAWQKKTDVADSFFQTDRFQEFHSAPSVPFPSRPPFDSKRSNRDAKHCYILLLSITPKLPSIDACLFVVLLLLLLLCCCCVPVPRPLAGQLDYACACEQGGFQTIYNLHDLTIFENLADDPLSTIGLQVIEEIYGLLFVYSGFCDIVSDLRPS